MKSITRKLTILSFFLSHMTALRSQDVHFADVQQMAEWYNQAIKTQRLLDIKVNIRDIQYQKAFAFRTETVLCNITMLNKKDRISQDGKSYMNISLGATFDKSNSQLYKKSSMLLGVSYATMIDKKNTYVSVGFQGNFSNTSLGVNGVYPDQLNQWGLIAGSSTNDPSRFNRSFNFFSLNTGIALFRNNTEREWYLGASVRHVNRPYTEQTKSSEFQLARTWGTQAGYKFKFDYSSFDIYGVTNWKGGASEYIGAFRYNLTLNNTSQKDVNLPNEQKTVILGIGCGIRLKDALIPSVSLMVNRLQIGLHLDLNTSSIQAGGFSRNGFELSITQKL